MIRWWLCGLCLILLVVTPASLAQDDDPVISPALQEQIDEIEMTTSAIRGLDLETPITRLFPTREALGEYFREVFDAELPDAVVAREVIFYAAFDFVPLDVDLRAVYTELYTAQVAGFYDTDTNEMNVILITGERPADELPLLEEITYSHEYVHALQDQHFDLDLILDGIDPENPDRSIATLSLIEGDATLAMTQYTLQRMQRNPTLGAVQILMEAARSGALTFPPGVPDIIIRELLFPYERGMDFVTYTFTRGGWDAVNALYDNPPTTTEQILHPERYPEAPLPITPLVPVDEILGEGWELVHDRTLGEFYLRQYLGTQLDARTVNIAATGWGNDQYLIYHNPSTGQIAWILRIVWDTDQDRTEFAAAYDRFAQARFTTPMDSPCYRSEDEAVCFNFFDMNSDSSLIAYAPDNVLAMGMIGIQLSQ